MRPGDRMRAVLAAGALVGLLLAGCAQSAVTEGPSSPSTSQNVSAETHRPESARGPYQLDKIIDGDTLRVIIDGRSTKVRLIGIDTPEIKHPNKPVQCFGPEATEHITQLIGPGPVWLEGAPPQDSTDRYGRTLAYVWTGNEPINQRMLLDGYGREYTYHHAYSWQRDFRDAQQDAKTHGRGLWSRTACGDQTSTD